MSVIRQQNWLGQQRIDIPHVRAIESAMAADFDLLAGQIIAGHNPLIVSGFALTVLSAGAAANTLQLVTASSVILHPQASESGTIFQVPASRAAETLNAANTRVSGSFTASATNYIGIDLRRTADATTADLVQFLDPNLLIEKPKTVPLARTLDYIIVISTQDFSTTPGIAPLAQVVTDSNNNIVSITDARNFFLRLGSGGTVTNIQHAYSWPGGRGEPGGANANSSFTAGDKSIGSLKEWMDAVMTRLWEHGGGEFWYSATADRNVKMVRTGAPPYPNGDWFTWDGTNLQWQSLVVVFDNSTGAKNVIRDQTTTQPGLTDLADGDCIYVDLDRTQNRTAGNPLIPVKTQLSTLSTSTIPGQRLVIAWRVGSGTTAIVTRDAQFPVNAALAPATTSSTGVVELIQTPGNPSQPVVLNTDANGGVTYAATGGNRTALIATGGGTLGSGVLGIGAPTGPSFGIVGQVGSNNAPSAGIWGQGGTGTGYGIVATGSTGGAGGPGLVVGPGGTTTQGAGAWFEDGGGTVRSTIDRLGFIDMGSRNTLVYQNWALPSQNLTGTASFASINDLPAWRYYGTAATENVTLGAVFPGGPTNGTPCVALLQSTAVASLHSSVLQLGYVANLGTNFSVAVEFEVFIGGSTLAAMNAFDFFVGLSSAQGNSNAFGQPALFMNATNGVGIGFRGGDTDYSVVTSNAASNTYTDTTVAIGGVTGGSSTMLKVRLEYHGSGTPFGNKVIAVINGNAPITVTTTIPNLNSLVYLVMGMSSINGTSTGTAQCYVGPVRVVAPRYASSPGN